MSTREKLKSKLFESGDLHFCHSLRFTTTSNPETVSETYVQGFSEIVAAVGLKCVWGSVSPGKERGN